MTSMPHPVESAAPTSTPRSEFVKGLRDSIPLIIGAIPFGIIFGALAVSSGMSVIAALAMSIFVFAGSSQFIAANMFAAQAAPLVIIFTTFIVNLRHALYGATLAPHLKNLSQKWLLPLGFWLTDETFAVTATYYNASQSPHKHWYQLGSSIGMYSNWFACTVIGVIAGQAITPDQARQLGFEFAMIVTFIGIVIPMVRTRPIIGAILAAGVMSVLTNHLDNKLGLVISALVGVAVGTTMEIWQKREVRS